MGDRGVIYMVWGDKADKVLSRSIDSVKRYHPELPIHVERLPHDPSVTDQNHASRLRNKSVMLDISPYRSTLYLDADTVVLGRLDYAFEKSERFGLACAICECPWARRYAGIGGDVIEYNTGVLFFTADKARPVFDAWKRLGGIVDSRMVLYVETESGRHLVEMPFNDQAAFAQAIEETSFQPHVLPLNWNLRPHWQNSFYGPIRIWHSYRDVPSDLLAVNQLYDRRGEVIDFHRTHAVSGQGSSG